MAPSGSVAWVMFRQNGAWSLNLPDLTGEEDVEWTETGGLCIWLGEGICP